MHKRKLPSSQASGRDDESGTQKRSTQSSSRGSSVESDEETQRLANDLIHFILVADQRKLPIKRLDINKYVLKGSSRQFKDVFSLAKQNLKKVFGLDVVEFDEKKNSFMLVNILNKKTIGSDYMESTEIESAKLGLLMLILSLIFMNGNTLKEGMLWKTLKRLGIDSDVPHPVFGDVKKLIMQDFRQQLYLEVAKVAGSDPLTHQFTWGSRAFQEVTKMKVLEFVCQVFGENMTCDYWLEQHHDAVQSAQEEST